MLRITALNFMPAVLMYKNTLRSSAIVFLVLLASDTFKEKVIYFAFWYQMKSVINFVFLVILVSDAFLLQWELY